MSWNLRQNADGSAALVDEKSTDGILISRGISGGVAVNRTVLGLQNANGVTCYLFPGAAGTTLVVQSTRP